MKLIKTKNVGKLTISHWPALLCLLASVGFSGQVLAQDEGLAPPPEAGLAESAEIVEQININEADAATIARELEGIGEVRAGAIVMYREENGEFTSLDDLAQVKGIGEQTLIRNGPRISFE